MLDDSDLLAFVHQQLPDGIRPKLGLRVECDAYRLRTKAIFEDARGVNHSCELDLMEINGYTISCKIPEVFLAHLCAVV